MAHKIGCTFLSTGEHLMKYIASRMRAFAFGALASLLLLTGAAQADPKQWTIVDLGALAPAGGGQAFGLNNRGDVVGGSFVPGCCTRPFVWRNGEMIDISPAGTRSGRAVAINAKGTAVLEMDGSRVFTWRDGVATLLPFFGQATDINNDDAVVGGFQAGFFTHAFVFRDGVLHDLGTLGGFNSFAFAINNAGVVVGNSVTAGNSARHPFVHENGVMRDIGTLGGNTGTAFDVNDGGTVVGAAQDASGRTFAFAWDAASGMRKLLDVPDSIANAINNRGDVVGTIGLTGAFLLSDGELTRLDALPAVQAAGFTAIDPEDINERGWIAGWASHPTRGTRAVLLMRKGS